MWINARGSCRQVAEITRVGSATKKVEKELKRAKGTGSIEEAKLVSEALLEREACRVNLEQLRSAGLLCELEWRV